MTAQPYYSESGIEIYCGDCREILPQLSRADLVLTDPPYGISRSNGMGGGGYGGFGKSTKRVPREYSGAWDSERPNAEAFALCLASADKAIIWGGNYFADLLPPSSKWLVWDKEQTMPSYSDAELAWTSLNGTSTQMFRYCGAGLLALEKQRFHPTQKPLALMKWCLSLVPEARTIIDPYMGAGSTLRAAKDLDRQAIGIEISEDYCRIAVDRLRQGILQFT